MSSPSQFDHRIVELLRKHNGIDTIELVMQVIRELGLDSFRTFANFNHLTPKEFGVVMWGKLEPGSKTMFNLQEKVIKTELDELFSFACMRANRDDSYTSARPSGHQPSVATSLHKPLLPHSRLALLAIPNPTVKRTVLATPTHRRAVDLTGLSTPRRPSLPPGCQSTQSPTWGIIPKNVAGVRRPKFYHTSDALFSRTNLPGPRNPKLHEFR